MVHPKSQQLLHSELCQDLRRLTAARDYAETTRQDSIAHDLDQLILELGRIIHGVYGPAPRTMAMASGRRSSQMRLKTARPDAS
jgi:hypothetical protein